MRIFNWYLGTWSLVLVAACGETETSTESDGSTTAAAAAPGEVRIVGQVDLIALCGTNGAKSVSFRATRVGCVPGPPAPCTVDTDNPYPETLGDSATCPASQTALDMDVVVEASGRYLVEARALTDGGYVGLCFGPGTADETPVSKEQVEAGTTIAVSARSGPCPAPP